MQQTLSQIITGLPMTRFKRLFQGMFWPPELGLEDRPPNGLQTSRRHFPPVKDLQIWQSRVGRHTRAKKQSARSCDLVHFPNCHEHRTTSFSFAQEFPLCAVHPVSRDDRMSHIGPSSSISWWRHHEHLLMILCSMRSDTFPVCVHWFINMCLLHSKWPVRDVHRLQVLFGCERFLSRLSTNFGCH